MFQGVRHIEVAFRQSDNPFLQATLTYLATDNSFGGTPS